MTLRTRRDFLRDGASLAAAAATVPSFLASTAAAVPSDGSGTILVLIQLAGGNDGLNTLVPFTNDDYYRARPRLNVPAADVLRLTDALGLCPELAPVKALYDAGQCAIVQGVGYPNPDRSHFRSMEIWETGSGSEKHESIGWVGRLFDARCPGCDRATAGVSVGSTLPQTFRNRAQLGVAVEDPEAFRTLTAASGKPGKPTDGPPTGGAADFLRRTAMNAQVSADAIVRAVARYKGATTYPSGAFGQSLRLISQMIAGELPARVYFASLGGFDTHANQVPAHPNLMRQFAEATAALVADLKEQGNLDRVVIMQFSEFGRRVAENASGGTDHGTAAPMFLFGGNVVRGLHGTTPSLTDLDQGDLKHSIDFRRVYASVVKGWLRADPAAIVGPGFDPLPLFG